MLGWDMGVLAVVFILLVLVAGTDTVRSLRKEERRRDKAWRDALTKE